MTDPVFLPGVPADLVLAALRRSPGNELGTGKFDAPESSAALAANAFGWFLTRPQALPPLPGVPMGQPEEVEVEAEMRFPWTGGRHPWLDAAITTATTLVGVESKRYRTLPPQEGHHLHRGLCQPRMGPRHGALERDAPRARGRVADLPLP